MSGGAIFQNTLRILCKHPLPDVAHSDCVHVLEANRTPLQFFYDAALEAKRTPADCLQRGSGVYFCYAAGQLADDLADGDCTYLENPMRTGPSVQFLLQSLFVATLSSCVPPETLHKAATFLAIGTGPQQVEVRTSKWTLDLSRQVAEGIAGYQIAAYLEILWADSELAPLALSVGRDLGVAAHIARDIETADPRFISLSDSDQAILRADALSAAERAMSSELRSVIGAVEPLLPHLRPMASETAA